MLRRLFPIALLCGLAAACASPEESFRALAGDGRPEFEYVAADYDLFPVRRPEGEAWRLQGLRQHLQERGLCPQAYAIDARSEQLIEAGFLGLGGDLFQVTYRGHCRE